MWTKVDDNFIGHPKVLKAASRLGKWGLGRVLVIWHQGQSHCAKYLTDGFIAAEAVARFHDDPKPLDVADALVSSRLWERCEGGYRVHDYLAYNPSAEEARDDQETGRQRKELYAVPGLVQAVQARDQQACRYCGATVNWKDRRGPLGGRYDRIDPGGPNTLENVVVACRRCVQARGKRPLAAAGMALRPAPSPDLDPEQEPRLGLDENGPSSELGPNKSPRARAGDPVPSRIDPVPSSSVCDTAPGTPAAAKPLAYRPRVDVAWPGRPPVPGSLHVEFVQKLGGDPDEAERRLREWYPVAAAAWADQPIGDDDFRFWRARFREWQGTTVGTTRSESKADAEHRRREAFLGRHQQAVKA
jgi:hypothetical protein